MFKHFLLEGDGNVLGIHSIVIIGTFIDDEGSVVKMNVCRQCGNPFSRLYLIKRISYPIPCPNCSKNYYLTRNSLNITFSMVFGVPIILLLLVMFNVRKRVPVTTRKMSKKFPGGDRHRPEFVELNQTFV